MFDTVSVRNVLAFAINEGVLLDINKYLNVLLIIEIR